MKFYDEIAHKLYVWNTNIEETEFEPFDFIEAKHNEAPFKGKVFYQNLIHAMPKHFGAKLRNNFFKEVLQYCQFKIDNIDKPKKTEFQFTYEQEVTEERKNALKKRLAKLKTAEEKISFLRDEKAKYLQNISPRTLEVSGSVHTNFAPNAELFFDRYIQIEIDKLERQNIKPAKNGSKLQAPDFALFCSIVNQCNIIEYDHKSKDDYCKVVSKYFKLVCPPNTRKVFSPIMDIKKKDEHLKKVIDLILPQIHKTTEKEKITQFINNKTKMYT